MNFLNDHRQNDVRQFGLPNYRFKTHVGFGLILSNKTFENLMKLLFFEELDYSVDLVFSTLRKGSEFR